ncbi:hypothetical protein N8482_01570 [Chitinophagales bacterium]|nr:hypothetical protein [Chitinophagales bacterium]
MNKLVFLVVFLFSVNESLCAIEASTAATELAVAKKEAVAFEGVVKYQISFETGIQLSADYLADLQEEFGTEETYYFKPGAYRRESGGLVQVYTAETTELIQWQARDSIVQTIAIGDAESELLSFSELKGKERIAEFKCKRAMLDLSEGSLTLWYHPDLVINSSAYSAHKRNYWSAIAEHTASIPLKKELRLGDELTVIYEAVVVHRRPLSTELFEAPVIEEMAEAVAAKEAKSEADLTKEKVSIAVPAEDALLLEELINEEIEAEEEVIQEAKTMKVAPAAERIKDSAGDELSGESSLDDSPEIEEEVLSEKPDVVNPYEVIRRELRELYSVEMLAGLEEDMDKRNALSNVFENPNLGITVEVVHESQSFLKTIGFMDYNWDDHKLFTTDRVRRYLEDIEIGHSKIVEENGMKHQRLIISGLTDNNSRVNFAIGLYETADHFYQVNVISTEEHYDQNKELIDQICSSLLEEN